MPIIPEKTHHSLINLTSFSGGECTVYNGPTHGCLYTAWRSPSYNRQVGCCIISNEGLSSCEAVNPSSEGSLPPHGFFSIHHDSLRPPLWVVIPIDVHDRINSSLLTLPAPLSIIICLHYSLDTIIIFSPLHMSVPPISLDSFVGLPCP